MLSREKNRRQDKFSIAVKQPDVNIKSLKEIVKGNKTE